MTQLRLRLLNRVAAPRIPRTPQRLDLSSALHTRLLQRLEERKRHAPPCLDVRHRQVRLIIAAHVVKEPLLKCV